MVVLNNNIQEGLTPGTGKMVIWEDIPGGPSWANQGLAYANPTAYWNYVKFASEFRYLNNSQRINGNSVSHASVAGVTGSGYGPPSAGGGQTGPIANGQVVVTNKTVYTHSLGYVPWFQLILNGRVISPGSVVQDLTSTSKVRMVSPYATSTIIGLKDIGISSEDALPAIDLAYDVILFRQPAVIPGAPLCDLRADGSDQPIIMGYGRITSELRPLRRAVVSDTDDFVIPYSRSVDMRNGALRMIDDVTEYDLGTYIGAFATAEVIRVSF